MLSTALALSGNAVLSPEANPLTIFGIRMMEDVSIPECPAFAEPAKWRKKYRTTAYPYAPPTSGICYRRSDRTKSGTNGPLAFETLEIQFAQGTEPALAYGVDALAIDGKIHAVKWFTRGASQQDMVLASLTQKFGKPAATSVDSKQNGYGAKFDAVRASWNLPQTVTVVFEGIGANLNQGTVAVMSKQARDKVSETIVEADKRIRI
jgi:hypothetical protein